ncbi:MAG: CinA family protein [Nocardioides sp.]
MAEDRALAASIHRRLRALAATVATAESLTGGRLAVQLTSIAGASRTFRGGFVTYATDLKRDVLGVPGPTIDRHGVVSAECAVAMAHGARRTANATYGVSTTGVAGPGPHDAVAAGTVFVGVAGPREAYAIRLALAGSRDQIQDLAGIHALSELLDLLLREDNSLE